MVAVTRLGFEYIELQVGGWMSVRQCHLVEMLCYGIDGNDLLLVIEYMSQGTLAQHLFKYQKTSPAKPLSWTRKLGIAVDVVPALESLHGFDLIFLHFDLKSSSALLDNDFNAKVSGFGLANGFVEGRLPPGASPSGYMAPEYTWAWWRTQKDHVYSFGVVLMELLTGLPAVNMKDYLLTLFRKEFWTKLGSAALHGAMDTHLVLGLSFHSDEYTTVESILAVAELAMDCTADNPDARPDMDHAVSVLRCLLLEYMLTLVDLVELDFHEWSNDSLPHLSSDS